MTRRTLVLGGVRSGKSLLAETLAAEHAGRDGDAVIYVATAQARADGEMSQRIATHRQRRPAQWTTIEAPVALAQALREHAGEGRCLLVDCLTLWLTNLLCAGDEALLEYEREAFVHAVTALPGRIVMVSNETGLGVVPMGELTRRYLDEAGALHQRVAAVCERVAFTVAGLPMWLKTT